MFPLCQSKFICGFAAMLENQYPALPSIFVIPDLILEPGETFRKPGKYESMMFNPVLVSLANLASNNN